MSQLICTNPITTISCELSCIICWFILSLWLFRLICLFIYLLCEKKKNEKKVPPKESNEFYKYQVTGNSSWGAGLCGTRTVLPRIISMLINNHMFTISLNYSTNYFLGPRNFLQTQESAADADSDARAEPVVFARQVRPPHYACAPPAAGWSVDLKKLLPMQLKCSNVCVRKRFQSSTQHILCLSHLTGGPLHIWRTIPLEQ